MNEEKKIDYSLVIAKKSERLVTALYLVTDLISDKEPIKNSLRLAAVSLLSSMNSLSQNETKDRVMEIKLSLKSTTEILSFLQVTLTTGIVSEMNGNILMEGFRVLQLILEKKQPILSKEMLIVDKEEEVLADTNSNSAILNTSYDVLTPLNIRRENRLDDNQNTFIKTESIKDKNNKRQISNLTNKSNQKVDINNNLYKKDNFKLASSFQVKKNGRRDQILSLFVKGVDVSIKDIASRIRGCSEKTIQRELNSLLYDNLIERIGEKRWSRYILR